MKNPRSSSKKRKHHIGGIPPKMFRFCEEYPKDLNGAKAVLRAGYNTKHPGQIAKRILNDDRVQDILSRKMEARTKKNDITVDRVLKELETVAFSNPLHYMTIGEDGQPCIDLSDMPERYAAAISEVYITENEHGKQIKFKLHSKLHGLDSLAKYLKMFTDRVEITGKDGGPIESKQVVADIAEMFTTKPPAPKE